MVHKGLPRTEPFSMAQAIVVFHQAGNRSLEREPMPTARLTGARGEVLNGSPASVATTLSAIQEQHSSNKDDGGFVTVYATTENLWVVAGVAPIAAKPAAGTSNLGFPVMAGSVSSFAVAAGDKVAVIEWS